MYALRYLWLAQSPPEFISSEIVHDRVQAAVQAGQAECDWVTSKNQFLKVTAGNFLSFDHKVERHRGVVRYKAH